MIQLDKEIKFALTHGLKDRLYVLRMIKAKELEFKTSKGYKEGDLTFSKECEILQKMLKTWNDEKDSLIKANRNTEEITHQINILKDFIPDPPTEMQIKEQIKLSKIEVNIKNTKLISNYIKEVYPSADNRLIVKCIKEYE
jgi:uncharacterized protein YqeY